MNTLLQNPGLHMNYGRSIFNLKVLIGTSWAKWSANIGTDCVLCSPHYFVSATAIPLQVNVTLWADHMGRNIMNGLV